MKRTSLLILEAERSGGAIEDVFESAHEHVSEVLGLKRERLGAMKPFTWIIFASFIVFSLVMIILLISFFQELAKQVVESVAQGQQATAGLPFNVAGLQLIFFHLMVIEAIFAGLIAGKKSRAIAIVQTAFEIIHLRTGKNPIQILVQAIENAAPREETTRISYGGISYHTACDVAPLRRIDLALRFLAEAVWSKCFGTLTPVEEIVADELIDAAAGDSRSSALRRREEKERMALSAR